MKILTDEDLDEAINKLASLKKGVETIFGSVAKATPDYKARIQELSDAITDYYRRLHADHN